jgi:hypothetical protein
MLQDKRITVTQEEIRKITSSQEAQSKARHEYELKQQQYQLRQRLYQDVLDAQKNLVTAEQALKEYDERRAKPVEVPKKKKERSMILRDGQWVELE